MINKSLIGFTISTMAFSALPAQAAPVFMTCSLTDSAGVSVFDVQLNEEMGQVSYFTRRNQIAVKRPAIFTPDMVTYSGFTISRKDLTFTRDDNTSGKCVIDTIKRAF